MAKDWKAVAPDGSIHELSYVDLLIELQDMIDEGKPIQVNCHFCEKTYEFSVEDLQKMLKNATRP